MLIRVLRALLRPREQQKHETGNSIGKITDSPIVRAQRLNAAHASAPTALHLDILFSALRINNERLVDLVDRCLADSNLPLTPDKYFHRPLASYFLAQYFLYARELPGDQ